MEHLISVETIVSVISVKKGVWVFSIHCHTVLPISTKDFTMINDLFVGVLEHFK
jgi:hypothetical protein